MQIELKLQNFRNHKRLNINFDENIFISGDNGTGKTSILEAISVLKQLKSFRSASFKNLVKYNEKYFKIEIVEVNDNFLNKINFFYGNKSVLTVNSDILKNAANHILNNPVFIYSPENEGLVSKNMQIRRKFLDKNIFYLNPSYYQLIKDYNKLFKLKSDYLKTDKSDNVYFDTINEKLTDISKRIIESRINLIDELNKNISILTRHKDISIDNFKIEYFPNYINVKNFKNELVRKKVIQGPHLDKLKIFKNNLEIEKFLSFGQKKTIGIICLLSSFLTVEEKLKNDIIFLLDDFETGLDNKSINFFKNLFSNNQYVMTGVKNNNFNDIRTINL